MAYTNPGAPGPSGRVVGPSSTQQIAGVKRPAQASFEGALALHLHFHFAVTAAASLLPFLES